ncbi:hypothetical protein EVAR_19470_1 [Eumeta japonica]|uniref:Uncharacterized protein n=1 Tax=Eumeta variegata TaxID=151549 RepID=A0A4C1V9L5_EUMVA|nr:hypothetical protein EVAR_19470_1 [Eumeta japonica]
MTLRLNKAYRHAIRTRARGCGGDRKLAIGDVKAFRHLGSRPGGATCSHRYISFAHNLPLTWPITESMSRFYDRCKGLGTPFGALRPAQSLLPCERAAWIASKGAATRAFRHEIVSRRRHHRGRPRRRLPALPAALMPERENALSLATANCIPQGPENGIFPWNFNVGELQTQPCVGARARPAAQTYCVASESASRPRKYLRAVSYTLSGYFE